jgi:hypothetical protein
MQAIHQLPGEYTAHAAIISAKEPIPNDDIAVVGLEPVTLLLRAVHLTSMPSQLGRYIEVYACAREGV